MCLKGAVRVWRGGFLLEEYKCLSFNCSKNEYDVICVRASIGDRANAGFGGLRAGGGLGRQTFAYGQLVFRARRTRDEGITM